MGHLYHGYVSHNQRVDVLTTSPTNFVNLETGDQPTGKR